MRTQRALISSGVGIMSKTKSAFGRAEASPQRRQAALLPSRLTGRPWREPSAASARFPGFGLESGLESGPVSGGWVQVPISRDLLPIPGFGARFSRPVSNGPFLRFSQAGHTTGTHRGVRRLCVLTRI